MMQYDHVISLFYYRMRDQLLWNVFNILISMKLEKANFKSDCLCKTIFFMESKNLSKYQILSVEIIIIFAKI